MPEPLKLMFDSQKMRQLAKAIGEGHAQFNQKKFLGRFESDVWENAELKQRVSLIAEYIHQELKLPFGEAVKLLIPVSKKFVWGYFGVFFSDYVEKYGLEHWDESMMALEEFTKTSTAEFAIRKFIRMDQTRAMVQMELWSKSENHHVRRLSSEGCRPRLPWGMRLDEFVARPQAVLRILERLKNDPELYVRKSVANNLNDISKDHPELVLQIAAKWIGKSANTDWIVKHALRTLLKKGNKQALELFGHHDAAGLKVHSLALQQKQLSIGEEMKFAFTILNENREVRPARIEFAIDYMKSNARHNRRVFHISATPLKPGNTEFKRRISFANLTTRKHYPGKHHLHVLINGEVAGSSTFALIP
jgi:3-methyladenine DNA glycosylase AlkC